MRRGSAGSPKRNRPRRTLSARASPPAAPRRRPARRGGRPPGCRGTLAGPRLLDDLVGADQERLGNGQAEGFSGLEVDEQLELGGLLDGKVGRLGTLENLVDVDGGATPHIDAARPIANQATGCGKI